MTLMFDPQTIQAANDAYQAAYSSKTKSPPHARDKGSAVCECYICNCWHHGYLDAKQKGQHQF